MAFHVLDEEQIRLLTDEQKAVYEDELEMYNARAAFVERMEALEDIEIPAYSPRIRQIDTMGEIPRRQFRGLEDTDVMQFQMPKPAKSRLADRSFSAIKRKKPALPCTVRPAVKTAAAGKIGIPQIELRRPEGMPERTRIRKRTFAAPEKTEPSLPKVPGTAVANLPKITPSAPDSLLEAASLPKLSAISQVKLPKISLSAMAGFPEAASLPEAYGIEPMKWMEALSAVSAGLLKAPSQPKVPERVPVKLPEITSVKPPEVSADLPPVPAIAAVNLPEMPVIAAASMPEINGGNFAKLESMIEEMDARIRIEPSIPSLPGVERPRDIAKTYEVPELNKPALPKQEKAALAPLVFMQPKIDRYEHKAAFLPTVPDRTFAGVEARAEALPQQIAIPIPDADELLRKWRFEINTSRNLEDAHA